MRKNSSPLAGQPLSSCPSCSALSKAVGKEKSVAGTGAELAAAPLLSLHGSCTDRTKARRAWQLFSFLQSKHPKDPGAPKT